MLYFNWQKAGFPPGPPYNAASPNLKTLLAYALTNFGGSNLGIYVVRPVTGGTSWSTHAYGAAKDWGYSTDYPLALRYIDFLIEHHVVLGVQMIVDEAHNRTWKCWRDELGGPGWKAGQVTGGGTWLHIETTPDKWADTTPIADRLPIVTPPAPPIPEPPAPTPTKEPIMYLEWRAGQPGYTGFIYNGTHLAHATSGDAVNVVLRGGGTKVTVTDTELLAVIQSSAKTTGPPNTLTPTMLAAWG